MAFVLTVGGQGYSWKPGTLSITETLGGRSTCEFSIDDPEGTLAVPAPGHEVIIMDGIYRIFGGSVESVEIVRYTGIQARVFRVSCVDYHRVLDRRLAGAYSWQQRKAGLIVMDIATHSLQAEAINIDFIQDGPIIERLEIDYPTVAEAVQQVAKLAKMFWTVDYGRQLRFFSPESYACPFELTPTSKNFTALTVRNTREQYANRVLSRIGEYVRDPQTARFDASGRTGAGEDVLESMKPDGTRKRFAVTYPIHAQPTVRVNGVERPVGVFGAGAVEWGWNTGSPELQQDAGMPALAAGAVLEISYVGLSSEIIAVQNDAEVDLRSSIEGGSGLYEVVQDSSTEMTRQDAQQFAAAILDNLDELSCVATVQTTGLIESLAPAARVGQRIHIDVGGYHTGGRGVTAVAYGSPSVITAPSHGRKNGEKVHLTGVQNLSGTWVVNNVTADTMSLVGSSASGSYSAGGWVYPLTYLIRQIRVADVPGFDQLAFSLECVTGPITADAVSFFRDLAVVQGVPAAAPAPQDAAQPDGLLKSPMDYGAVGDGVANDTAAVAACAASNDAWEVPAGKTFLTDSITISGRARVSISGAGTLKRSASAGTGLLWFYSCPEVRISGVHLDDGGVGSCVVLTSSTAYMNGVWFTFWQAAVTLATGGTYYSYGCRGLADRPIDPPIADMLPGAASVTPIQYRNGVEIAMGVQLSMAFVLPAGADIMRIYTAQTAAGGTQPALSVFKEWIQAEDSPWMEWYPWPQTAARVWVMFVPSSRANGVWPEPTVAHVVKYVDLPAWDSAKHPTGRSITTELIDPATGLDFMINGRLAARTKITFTKPVGDPNYHDTHIQSKWVNLNGTDAGLPWEDIMIEVESGTYYIGPWERPSRQERRVLRMVPMDHRGNFTTGNDSTGAAVYIYDPGITPQGVGLDLAATKPGSTGRGITVGPDGKPAVTVTGSLVNPDFSDGLNGWYTSDSTWALLPLDANFVLSTSGNPGNCCRINVTPGVNRQLIQEVTCPAGTPMRQLCTVINQTGVTAYCGVAFTDSAGQPIATGLVDTPIQPGASWTAPVNFKVAPAGSVKARFKIYTAGATSGYLLVDTCALISGEIVDNVAIERDATTLALRLKDLGVSTDKLANLATTFQKLGEGSLSGSKFAYGGINNHTYLGDGVLARQALFANAVIRNAAVESLDAVKVNVGSFVGRSVTVDNGAVITVLDAAYDYNYGAYAGLRVQQSGGGLMKTIVTAGGVAAFNGNGTVGFEFSASAAGGGSGAIRNATGSQTIKFYGHIGKIECFGIRDSAGNELLSGQLRATGWETQPYSGVKTAINPSAVTVYDLALRVIALIQDLKMIYLLQA
jgi:hypothetical protein